MKPTELKMSFRFFWEEKFRILRAHDFSKKFVFFIIFNNCAFTIFTILGRKSFFVTMLTMRKTRKAKIDQNWSNTFVKPDLFTIFCSGTHFFVLPFCTFRNSTFQPKPRVNNWVSIFTVRTIRRKMASSRKRVHFSNNSFPHQIQW